jgi:virginiamycin B lyase
MRVWPAGLLVGAAALLGALAPDAAALSIDQHPLPGGASLVSPEAISATANGLQLPPTATGPAFETLNTSGTVSFTAGPAGPSAIRLTLGPNGEPWYVSTVLVKERDGSELPHATIFEVTPGGVVQRATYSSPADAPVSIATGPDGALWMANDGSGDSVDSYLPGGQIVRHPAPGPPISIAPGPDRALWFTDAGPCPGYGGPCIGRITTTGEVSYHPLPWPSGPYGITAGGDGALWFAEWQISAIGRMTTDGQLRQFPIQAPAGALVGAGGPTPAHLVAAADGTIWFTDPGDDSVGHVTPGGEVSEYPIPPLASGERVQPALADAVPEGIAAGPEGLLWVTEANARAIASVDPKGQPASVPLSRGRVSRHRGRRVRRGRRALRWAHSAPGKH